MFKATMAVLAPARPVILFGYESSAFTWKVRLALKLKQIPYKFVTVPSMMPRPRLRDAFNLTYRKIPVLALGRDVYCDTSLICDALEHFFPASHGGHGELFPSSVNGQNYRPMMRGFASYWIDRPFFRATCGMMPADIWRTSFGTDRAGLIGHKLDPDKLEKKIPENFAKLDSQLSMLEPMFLPKVGNDHGSPWIFSTNAPSYADISMYTQLWWCNELSSGRLMHNLTGGGIPDAPHPGPGAVFNPQRYPGISAWYANFEQYYSELPKVEIMDPEWLEVLQELAAAPEPDEEDLILPTPAPSQSEVDAQCGLVKGSRVSVAPDDTGRSDAQTGKLVASSPEEFVVTPVALEKPPEIEVRIHFPRLAFVARPAK